MRSKNRGLLSQSHDNEAAGPCTQGPEPSAARLGPRGFSAGVLDSFGDILADCTLWSLVSLGVGN